MVTDSGLYICLAINNKDMKYKGTFVNVTENPRYNDTRQYVASFSLLFLIPLSLAIIPIIIWFWFMWYRRRVKQQRKRNCDNDVKDYRQVLRIVNNSNGVSSKLSDFDMSLTDTIFV